MASNFCNPFDDYVEALEHATNKVRQEYESLQKIRGYVARGADELDFFPELPHVVGGVWVMPFNNNNYLKLPDEMLPEIKAGSEPVEVELLIRKV